MHYLNFFLSLRIEKTYDFLALMDFFLSKIFLSKLLVLLEMNLSKSSFTVVEALENDEPGFKSIYVRFGDKICPCCNTI